ncbi:MAG: DUF6056 family protein [Oscillospiraceae bacterium]|jgi:hypothetical protein|nr:DUF6056 family protein [Oscillospiraceae bacterium]
MIKLKAKAQKIYRNDYFPFLVLAFGMLVIHMILPMNSGDDTYYSTVLKTTGLSVFLRDHYFGWSSRLAIETVMVFIEYFPHIIWRLTDTAIVLLLGVSISKLTAYKNNRFDNWLITILLFAYPFIDMDTAGWETTTLNCLWVLALGVYVLSIVKKIVLQQKKDCIATKIKKHEYAFSIMALLFSANQEQMCIVLLAIFIFLVFYLLYVKRRNWFIFAGLAICITSLVFILTCPGNAVRKNVEMRYFQDFNHISVIDKLEIGVSSTLAHYFLQPNLIFIIFCILLCAAVHIKYADKLYRLYSDIPITIALFFSLVLKLVPNFFTGLSFINTQMTEHGLITLENFTKAKSYMSLLILCGTFCIVLVSLYLVFGNTWQSICAVGTMLLGFLSRVAMGFSPTVWASDTRTYIYMYGAIIICSVMLYHEVVKNGNSKFAYGFVTCTAFAATISTLNMLMII